MGVKQSYLELRGLKSRNQAGADQRECYEKLIILLYLFGNLQCSITMHGLRYIVR